MKALHYDMIICLTNLYSIGANSGCDNRGFTPLVSLLHVLSLNNSCQSDKHDLGNGRRKWNTCLSASQLSNLVVSLLPLPSTTCGGVITQMREQRNTIWKRSYTMRYSLSSGVNKLYSMNDSGDIYDSDGNSGEYESEFDPRKAFKYIKKLRRGINQLSKTKMFC